MKKVSEGLTLEMFSNEITQSNVVYDFRYNDLFIDIWRESKGKFNKRYWWFFIVHKHDNKGNEIYSIYKNPCLLLKNARVDGKSLQEIWDELIISDF